jgi:hypothetical protein
MTRTLSITIKENNYQDLKKLIGSRQISKFVNQAVEKELEQKKKELIVAYQSSAKSKKLQQEAEIWEEALEDIK